MKKVASELGYRIYGEFLLMKAKREVCRCWQREDVLTCMRILAFKYNMAFDDMAEFLAKMVKRGTH